MWPLKRMMRESLLRLVWLMRSGRFEGGKKIVLITLPHPRKPPEAYFLALITPPPQRSCCPGKIMPGWSGWNITSDGTHLCDLTPRAIRVDQGIGPRPVLGDFYQAVYKLVNKKLR